MRTVGTLVIVYGLILVTIGQNVPIGGLLVLVGWLIRRATRPELCTCGWTCRASTRGCQPVPARFTEGRQPPHDRTQEAS